VRCGQNPRVEKVCGPTAGIAGTIIWARFKQQHRPITTRSETASYGSACSATADYHRVVRRSHPVLLPFDCHPVPFRVAITIDAVDDGLALEAVVDHADPFFRHHVFFPEVSYIPFLKYSDVSSTQIEPKKHHTAPAGSNSGRGMFWSHLQPDIAEPASFDGVDSETEYL